MFSNNRIEESLRALADADVVVNEISLCREDGDIFMERYISKRLKDQSVVNLDFIRDKNIFGLSNTAVRVCRLKRVTFPSYLEAVDWYFFSVLLLDGLRAKFITSCHTIYRQHVENTVGLGKQTAESFERALIIKKAHYALMSERDESFNCEREYVENILSLKSAGKLASLDNNLIKSERFPLWWEQDLRIWHCS